jgi:hypothetical protein
VEAAEAATSSYVRVETAHHIHPTAFQKGAESCRNDHERLEEWTTDEGKIIARAGQRQASPAARLPPKAASASFTPIPIRLRNWVGSAESAIVHVVGENSDPLPTLDSATAVRDAVSRLIADVYASRLHPRIAAGLVPLMHLQLRAIEITNIE